MQSVLPLQLYLLQQTRVNYTCPDTQRTYITVSKGMQCFVTIALVCT